jgi:preprotein translocase subunit SecG
MLSTLLHIFYVPVCVFLILVVLLQTGKRADLAGAFGGGGSQTAFGARGAATLLAKVTTGSAVMFMVIALALSIMSSRQDGGTGTVLDEVPASTEAPAPTDSPLGFTEPETSDAETPPEPTGLPGGAEGDAADSAAEAVDAVEEEVGAAEEDPQP